jgi:phosphate transport system substrate-binding protein
MAQGATFVTISIKSLARSLAFAAALGAAASGLTAPASAADISGAGATFPFPVYAKWAEAYKKLTGVGLNYQSIGSGGGIKQIQARTVTFGASDMPLKPADLDQSGLIQFPMIMGGVVPVVNLKGIKPGEVKLDGPTLAALYMGDIRKWNDAAVAKLNPGLKLPNTAVAPVYRSDGSGTNFLFTDYLSKVSPKFKDEIGSNTSVQWPVGIGAKGNEGVANMTTQTDGAIGYVEYAYVKQNKMSYALLTDHEGKPVEPAAKSFQAAAANADWAGTPGFAVILTDEPGAGSWPITGTSFILLPKQPPDPAVAQEALKFFSWAYKHGGPLAEQLDYVPMPDKVVSLVEQTWKDNVKDGSGKALWQQAAD